MISFGISVKNIPRVKFQFLTVDKWRLKLYNFVIITVKEAKMIEFKHIRTEDKTEYEKCLFGISERGCEASFANLYMWGRQKIAFLFGQALVFSQFNRKSVYPYPVGNGDKKAAIDAIIADAEERGIPCRITGLNSEARQKIEELYPQKFRFYCDRASFDYVYDINDLADLKGKKYQKKRNHFNRFCANNPEYRVEPVSDANIEAVRELVDSWYKKRMAEDPEADFVMEQVALSKALRDYKELDLRGIAVFVGDEPVAITFGSRMSNDTFDIHFEKAKAEVDGAYAAVNCEFARYIRANFPDVKFFNREEDMGLEGLRKAKESYYPHHMVEKCWACLLEDGCEY